MNLPAILRMGSSPSGSRQPPEAATLPTFATAAGPGSLPFGSVPPFFGNAPLSKAHRPCNQKICFDKLNNSDLAKMDTAEPQLGSERNSGSVVCSSTTFARVSSLAAAELLTGPRANSSREEESSSAFAADSAYLAIEHRPPSKPTSAHLIRLVALGLLLGKRPLYLHLFQRTVPILPLNKEFSCLVRSA